MAVECHGCRKTLAQDNPALALQCGHVCCTACIKRWVTDSNGDKRRCPSCTYIPLPGEVPRSVVLRFAVNGLHSHAAKEGLNETEGRLKTLVQHLAGIDNLTSREIREILDETEKVHANMTSIYHSREMQEAMSTQLAVIKEGLPRLQDRLEATDYKLAEQLAVGEELRNKLELKHDQIEIFQRALDDQIRSHELELAKRREEVEQLNQEKERWRVMFMMERKNWRDEIEQSAESITELRAAVNKVNQTIIGSKRKVPEEDLEEPASSGKRWKGPPPNFHGESSHSSLNELDDKDSTEPGEQAPLSEVQKAYSFRNFQKSRPASSSTTASPSKGPKPRLLGWRFAKAFLDFYSSLKQIDIPIVLDPGAGREKRASAILEGRSIQGYGVSDHLAKRECYRAVCIYLQSADTLVWEEFLHSSSGAKFSQGAEN